jgi:hypothetical protein
MSRVCNCRCSSSPHGSDDALAVGEACGQRWMNMGRGVVDIVWESVTRVLGYIDACKTYVTSAEPFA